MSRLKETDFQDIPGWQWDDGPIFVGDKGREHAVKYGKAVQWVEEWVAYAKLCQEQVVTDQRLEHLKTLKLQKDIVEATREGRLKFRWPNEKTEEIE